MTTEREKRRSDITTNVKTPNTVATVVVVPPWESVRIVVDIFVKYWVGAQQDAALQVKLAFVFNSFREESLNI